MADHGRSRGRARGRPVGGPQQQQQQQPPIDMSSLQQSLPSAVAVAAAPAAAGGGDNGGNGGNGGNGSSAAVRGRAGYRTSVRTRPAFVNNKQGSGGKSVRLLANYFRLNPPKAVIVYDYHVDFEPDIDSRIVRKGLLYNESIRQVFRNKLIFDGMSNLKSTILLPSQETEFFAVRNTDQSRIRIRVRRVGELGWSHQEMFRLYNTQMRRNFQLLGWNLIGRHYFNPKVTHDIPEHKLTVMQGLLTAINLHDGGGILMAADTVHKVIRKDSVLDNLRDIYKDNPNGFTTAARRQLTGSIVITKYNNRTYRISDLDFEQTPLSTFPKRDNTRVSYVDYYRQQYNIPITDTRQPLLIAMPSLREQRSGQTGQIMLVPELCNMTGISDSMADDFRVRQSLTRRTQQDPNQRVDHLNEFIGSLGRHPQIREDMKKWDLEFDDSLVEVTGRQLDCEKIITRGLTPQTGISWEQKKGEFTSDIRGKQMFSAVPINAWTIICGRRDQNITQQFAQTLRQVLTPLGVGLGQPQINVIDNDRTSTYVEASKAVPPSCQIIVVILPNNNKDRYDAIKKIFCCDHPMASQLVVSRTLSKNLMSVSTKIGIQMACKLGAEPWVLDIPPPNLMVVGFDVNRDSAMRERAIGAFVCSTNSTLTKWYSCVSPHKNREELSNNFKMNFQSGLKRYYDINKKPPQTIVIYRDGVSEGDIEYVYDYELKQITDSIKSIFNEIPIKLCFTIVTKRINTRLFLRVNQNQCHNPQPGTVVDSVVTRDDRYDFFLVSQSVRQGTVTPTMYNIIKDDTRWAPHRHQQLAYKLTHLYYNWIGTIRVPAPCQYAHKLAYLTGTALHRPFHSSLSNSLFYL
ncbi:piwi-like protein Siwi [Oppia nitens]|uniref:piwi-like protein Siwi n=1 Tax=Oppia nitens TaxID=1686743 RepID=UPI0023DBF5E7|nr:piwi-like protein Siwi [Oppia nitens]